MKINIVCVGKIKSSDFKNIIEEYIKRLSSYCRVDIIEVSDEPIKDDSKLYQEKIKEIEGEKLLSKIKEKDYVIALNLHKKQIDSVDFSKKIDTLSVKGVSTIDFVIGGSLGLGENILKRVNEEISLSEMTFTHQMTRIIMLEQIYRAYKIINNETYHK